MVAAKLVIERPASPGGPARTEGYMPHRAERAFAVYEQAIRRAARVEPVVAQQTIQGESFPMLLVPVGKRYDDFKWLTELDDAIANLVVASDADCLGLVAVEYVRHL